MVSLFFLSSVIKYSCNLSFTARTQSINTQNINTLRRKGRSLYRTDNQVYENY